MRASIPLLAVVAAGVLWWLARRERHANRLERKLTDMEERARVEVANRSSLDSILTHELRSPIAAVLGYQELLADGVLGPLDPRARDAVDRIARATRQLRTLTDGLDALTADIPAPDAEEFQDVDPSSMLRDAVAEASPDATLRGTSIDFHSSANGHMRMSPALVQRILDLAIQAAIRVTPAGLLRASVDVDQGHAVFEIRGAALPVAPAGALDDSQAIRDGATLRLLMAHRMARSLGGRVYIVRSESAPVIRIDIPDAH
jgi:signal transduction histidine kinase